jgi:hypothetical protein
VSDVDSRVRKVTLALLGLAVGGLIGSLLVGVVVIAQVRVDQESNSKTLRIIEDCTQPTGECFKDGQRRTAKAVGDINTVIITAAACAAGVDPSAPVDRRLADITKCVTERLTDAP